MKNDSVNEESEEYRCESCGLIFSSILEKTSHRESCNNIDDPLKISEPVVMVDVEEDKTVANCGPFNCEECRKVFKRKEHLHQHRRLHTGKLAHWYNILLLQVTWKIFIVYLLYHF